ncbi:MAG: hypothetical protein IIY16_07885 [Oscillospiraceae bacterium]|nr:hypothetical protein [Oscillospiraceae bacterium]
MEERNLTQEELDIIDELQAKKDAETHYTERPKSQRILAWILTGLMVLGVISYYYWIIVPQ